MQGNIIQIDNINNEKKINNKSVIDNNSKYNQ